MVYSYRYYKKWLLTHFLYHKPRDSSCTCTACNIILKRRMRYLIVQAYPLLLVSVELDTLDGGAEPLKLIHPIVQSRLGNDHQVRACDASVLIQVGNQADCLQRLPQPLQEIAVW
jgi:hypothetical protein